MSVRSSATQDVAGSSKKEWTEGLGLGPQTTTFGHELPGI